MQSDIEMISGGGGRIDAAREASALFSPRTELRPAIRPRDITHTQVVQEKVLNSRIVMGGGFLVILLILGFLGYAIAYPQSKEPAATPPPAGGSPRPSIPLGPPVPPPVPIQHTSFFRIPADQNLHVTMNAGPAISVFDLQTYGQKVTDALEITDPRQNFFEIEIATSEGDAMAIGTFLPLINAPFLESSFLTENFLSDFTAFAYRDSQGLWPGYVLRAARGITQLTVERGVAQKIEAAREAIMNLFTSVPGQASRVGFQDTTAGTRPARMLAFGPDERGVAAGFTYAWFNNTTLVVSTSPRGLLRAFEHLGR